MEPPGDRARRTRRPRRPRRSPDRLARIDHERCAAHRDRIRAPFARVARRLELDRRLPLVVDLGADPGERGDRVEQAAHAGRRRRGRAGDDQPVHLRPGARVDAVATAIAGSSGSPLERRRQPRARHPPRLLDRPLAAGQRDRQQRRRRGGTSADVAEQQLAAPDRAVEPVPGAVEDRADARARARRARPGTRPGARGGAGPRSARRRRARARTSSTGTRGGGRGRRPRARPRTAARKCSIPSVNERSVS